jgi:hypothetical protein
MNLKWTFILRMESGRMQVGTVLFIAEVWRNFCSGIKILYTKIPRQFMKGQEHIRSRGSRLFITTVKGILSLGDIL